MQITVRLTQSGSLEDAVKRQVPFALSLALNATVKDIQAGMRAELPGRFTLRRRQFIERLVKIERDDFARKDRLIARVGIQGPRAELLAKFEAGGPKVPRAGTHVAIPVRARRTKSDIIRANERPRALLSKAGRAFIRPGTEPGEELILRAPTRRTKGRPELLYLLKRRVILPPILGFFALSHRVVRSSLASNFSAALRRALATAK